MVELLWAWARSLGLPIYKMVVIILPPWWYHHGAAHGTTAIEPLHVTSVFPQIALSDELWGTDWWCRGSVPNPEVSRKSPFFWFIHGSECGIGRRHWYDSHHLHPAWGALESTQNSKVHTQVHTQQKSLLKCMLVGFWYLKENYENGTCTSQSFLTHLRALKKKKQKNKTPLNFLQS